MKRFVVAVCVALLMASGIALDPGTASADRCGKVWVEGHHNRYGKWIPGHWKHRHWVRGHHDAAGRWIPGHCR